MTQYGEDYLTPEEAAALLEISRRTLERYVKDQNIPRYQRGKKQILFKRQDIQRLMDVRPEDKK